MQKNHVRLAQIFLKDVQFSLRILFWLWTRSVVHQFLFKLQTVLRSLKSFWGREFRTVEGNYGIGKSAAPKRRLYKSPHEWEKYQHCFGQHKHSILWAICSNLSVSVNKQKWMSELVFGAARKCDKQLAIGKLNYEQLGSSVFATSTKHLFTSMGVSVRTSTFQIFVRRPYTLRMMRWDEVCNGTSWTKLIKISDSYAAQINFAEIYVKKTFKLTAVGEKWSVGKHPQLGEEKRASQRLLAEPKASTSFCFPETVPLYEKSRFGQTSWAEKSRSERVKYGSESRMNQEANPT